MMAEPDIGAMAKSPNTASSSIFIRNVFNLLLNFLFVVHLRRFGIRACVSVSYGSVGGAAAAAHAVQVMPISPLIVAIYKIKIK